jgi:DNA-binding winged helix-turn-helix (wHTH) protein
MNPEQFIIDNRFTVDFSRNLLHDKKNNIETKFEPRIGHLLFIFIQKQGEVVPREFIIKEIWDNYLGANEGLNQAIFFLRKLLDDCEKNIILTIPKKGYSFNADVSKISNGTLNKRQPIKTPLIAAAFFFIFCIGAYSLIQTIQFSTKHTQESGLTQKEMGEQDAINKAVSNSTTKKLFQSSFSKQNQQSSSTLIEMCKEDAKMKSSFNRSN